MDTEDLEGNFTNKLDDFSAYFALVYISDKSKGGKPHLMPGEWILKLPSFIKKLKKAGYTRPFSVKLDLTKEELADVDKIEIILSKSREFIEKYMLESE